MQGLKKHLLERIAKVVRDIGVHRIDHGVNAIEDKNLCDEIKRRSLTLTICLISNAYVVDETKSEVIAAVLQAGMRVTVNSNDPAFSLAI